MPQGKTQAPGKGGARGCLGLIVLFVVIVVIIAAASGGSSKTPKQQAQAYISSMHRDINTVQVSVQSVQAGIEILKKDGATQDAVNQFAQLAQQAHDASTVCARISPPPTRAATWAMPRSSYSLRRTTSRTRWARWLLTRATRTRRRWLISRASIGRRSGSGTTGCRRSGASRARAIRRRYSWVSQMSA